MLALVDVDGGGTPQGSDGCRHGGSTLVPRP
jgi:hypothetical protein